MRYLSALLIAGVAGLGCRGGGSSTPPREPETASNAPAPQRPRPRPLGPGRRQPGLAELQAAATAAEKGDLALGLQKCREAIEKNPNLEHAYLLAGSICAMQGDVDCERQSYEDGLAALPRSSALLRERAMVHLQQGETAEAVEKYEAAYEITGDTSAETMADLAYAYIYAKRLDEAADLARRAVALDAKCFTCRMSLGQVSLVRRDFPAALTAFQAAVELRPKDPDARRSEAKALFLTGDVGAAGSIYEALVKETPSDGRLRVQAAQVAMKDGRYRDAVGHLEVVAAANPGQRKLLELLAEAQKGAGDDEGAKATLRKASQLK